MEEIVYYIKVDEDFNKSLSLLKAFINFGKTKEFETEPRWFTQLYNGDLECLIKRDLQDFPNVTLVYYFHRKCSGQIGLNGWTYELMKRECELYNYKMVEWSPAYNTLEISIF